MIARASAKRVAPGTQPIKPRALKGAKYAAQYFGLSGLNAAY